MFYINKDTPLTTELLSKMINAFMINKAKLEKYKKYYDGEHDILNRNYVDKDKTRSRTVISYPSNIANSYTGYIATPGFISYAFDGDNEEVMDVLRYNDYQAQDAAFLSDMVVYGVATELMYLDKNGQTRFRLIKPTTCFGIYDDSLTGDLLYFVRIYKASEWDESELYYMDVYNDVTVVHYKLTGMNGTPEFMSEEPHYFNQCPANIAYMPDEKSVFDCVLSKVDAINELISAEIDDYSAFCDAYLVLEGADLDSEEAKKLRQNRILNMGTGSKAYWLTKNANDTQVENIRKFLHDAIYRDAQCPDFSSESFVGGVSSGIAIQYRLTGMETRAGMIEAIMKKALQRRVELICGVAALKLGEEVFRDVQITFKRNIPEDVTSTINIINALKGTVSDATLLGQVPFITDVNAEIEAVNAQKAANIEMYGFGLPAAANEEEEEETE